MRAMEIFEAEPDYKFLFRRLDACITEVWIKAADNPSASIQRAKRLYLMISHINQLIGQDENKRRLLLEEIRRFLDFMRS